MYFNFEDDRPDTPTIARPLSPREGVMLSIILHLLGMIVILVLPTLPFVKAAEERRLQALEQRQAREMERERERENARFVFVQPRLETPAPKPPPRPELSDLDRRARTVERAPTPTNPLPFARGNSSERIDAGPVPREARPVASEPPAAGPADVESPRQGMPLPEARTGLEQRSTDADRQPNRSKAVGVIADAIRNVQKYAQGEGFSNLQGGADQDFAPYIQFDTKGIEFGPWLRRFIAQVRQNWIPLIPEAARTMHGHAVITFNVHRDGRITDVTVAKPSAVDGFTRAAFYAMLASNPTIPLPPEYPEDRVFFTVTFYYNERPG
jgi:TonB family protein